MNLLKKYIRYVPLFAFVIFAATAANAAGSSTTTTLTSSVNPVNQGQTVIFTATVAGSTPTGTVSFSSNGSSLGTVNVSAGTASVSISYNSPITQNITAVYNGDANNLSSTGTFVETVNKLTSTTVLTSSVNPAVIGQNVTLTATITSSQSGVIPTGLVTFKDGTTVLGTTSMSSAVATLTASFSTTGAQPNGSVWR